MQRAMRRKLGQVLCGQPVSSSYVGMIRFKFTGLAFAISARPASSMNPTTRHPGAGRILSKAQWPQGMRKRMKYARGAGLHPASIQAVGWSSVG